MSTLNMRVEDLILPAPLQFQDQIRVSIAANDYAANSTGLPRLDRGFNIKGDVAGEYEVITLAAFRRKLFDRGTTSVAVADYFNITNGERNSLLQAIKLDSTVASRTIQLAANQWNDCPLVFVEKTNAADATIDIGII